MSATDPWTRDLVAGLSELVEGRGGLDAGEDWRLLVLLGRAIQHPSPPPELEALVERCASTGVARRALQRVALPDGAQRLDALDAALFGGGASPGAALRELDDLLAVLDLAGRREEARHLVEQAVALVELGALAAVPLAERARERLATLEPEASAVPLWEAVAASPALAVLGALPLAREPSEPELDRLLERAGVRRTAEVIDLFRAPAVERAWAAAAADYGAPWQPVEGGEWTAYAEGGRTVVQLHVEPGTPPPSRARLVVEAGGRRWTHRLRARSRSGDSAWFELGSERELARLFERAREALGVARDAEVRVLLEWDGDGSP